MGVWIETSYPLEFSSPCLVTPCVGVWIETFATANLWSIKMSHPAWVCGLKRLDTLFLVHAESVTPCVGVWIETPFWVFVKMYFSVTPCVGVWIETNVISIYASPTLCHTLRGCVD